MKPQNPTARIVAVGAAVLAAIALSGCSLISGLTGSNATRDAESGEVVQGGQESAFSMRVGDCWNDPSTSAEQISEIETVPCSEAHDNEVIALFDMPDGDFPGAAAVESAADEGCAARFADYIGLSYEESELILWPLWPTEDSWNQMKDREIVCSVYDPNGRLTGSVKGSAR